MIRPNPAPLSRTLVLSAAAGAWMLGIGCSGGDSSDSGSDPPPGGGGGGSVVDCPTGETLCDSGCFDLATNPAHCGACGSSCGVGSTCVDGACGCAGDRTDCDGSCVDTDTDASHCGACGNACDADTVCSQGECKTDCDSGLQLCGRSCVDTDTSEEHCGACDAACSPQMECSAGECACPEGKTACGGDCVTVATDRKNCGSCGNACGGDENCEEGDCVAVSTGGTGGSGTGGAGTGGGGTGGTLSLDGCEDAGTWRPLHGDGITPIPEPLDYYKSAKPKLAIGPGGRTFLGYVSADESGVYEVTSSGFELLGDKTFDWGHSLDMAAPPSAPAHITMVYAAEAGTKQRPTLRQWNGSSWDDLGRRPQTGSTTDIFVVYDANGDLVFGTTKEGTRDTPEELRLARWTGSRWDRLDVPTHDNTLMLRHLVRGPGGHPVMQVLRSLAGFQNIRIEHYQYNGRGWDKLPETGFGHVTQKLVAGPDGQLAVVREEEGNTEIQYFDGSAWSGFGGPGGGVGDVVLDADDVPYVAWTDSQGDRDSTFHVGCWDGQAWIALGDPLNAHPGGVGHSSTDARVHSLAIRDDGTLLFAWAEELESQTPERVHLWHYAP